MKNGDLLTTFACVPLLVQLAAPLTGAAAVRESAFTDATQEQPIGTVYVLGEVAKPGAYKASRGLTVGKAIDAAGGMKRSKGLTPRIRIIRMIDGKKDARSVSLDDIVQPDELIEVRLMKAK